MRFLSVCSGIEAASVAWRPLGWKPLAFAEIEPFPRAVLQHHYPDTPLHGDFTKLRDEKFIVDADALVGGTPCQGFSISGLRGSLSDDRSNLCLEFVRLANAIDDLRRADGRESSFILWENVPGVLSVKDNAFGTFLAGLCGCDAPIVSPREYGWSDAGVVVGPKRVAAWRVLDAQYFGLAQRRKRVFVLAHGGPNAWRCADALLPIVDSMQRYPTARGKAREDVAPTLSARIKGGGGLGTDFDCDGGLVARSVAFGGNNQSGPIDVATAQTAHGGTGRLDFESETFIAHALKGEGFDGSEDGTGRGTPIIPIQEPTKRTGVSSTSLKAGDGIGAIGDPMFTLQAGAQHGVAIAFDETQITSAENRCNPQPGDPCHPLATGARPPTLAFHARQDPDSGPVTHPLDTDGTSIGILHDWRVRRLLVEECESLQGFPQGYTQVPYRGKPAADGPRYKSLGNSFAVPVVRWIGQRIELVTTL